MLAFVKHIAAPTLYWTAFFGILFFSLRGKVHSMLWFVVPLMPLQNVLNKFHTMPFGKDLIDIVFISLIVGWLFRSFFQHKAFLRKSPFNGLLILLALYTFFSLVKGAFFLRVPFVFSGADPRVQTWKNYMLLPLLYFLTLNNIETQKQGKRLIFFMALSMLLVQYYTAMQIRWFSGLESRVKLVGTFVYLGPNEVAAFFTGYLFIYFGLVFFDKEKKLKPLYIYLVYTSIFCVLFLFSRGAYLALSICLIIGLFIKKKILIVPIVILMIFWHSLMPQEVLERINQSETTSGELDPSIQKRLDVWEQSISFFHQAPLTGIGFNTFPFLDLILGDTHNIYLKTLTEQGIIGIGLLLAILLLSLRSGIRLFGIAKEGWLRGLGFGFSLCVLSFIILNIFGDRWTYLSLGAYFWVFLALVVRGIEWSKEQRDGDESPSFNK